MKPSGRNVHLASLIQAHSQSLSAEMVLISPLMITMRGFSETQCGHLAKLSEELLELGGANFVKFKYSKQKFRVTSKGVE